MDSTRIVMRDFRRNAAVKIGRACLASLLITSASQIANAADAAPKWEACGWGGGGCFYTSAFHPTKKGVIYMGGDVNGVSKTEDNARNWRLSNNGLVDYGVFSLAVDRNNPDTVYAATQGGLCKSTDAGESWKLLPNTEKKNLHITGEKDKSIRCIAVDPKDGNIIYAGSPIGKVYKTTDGGLTWKAAYEKKVEPEPAGVLRVQFGKVSNATFGGIYLPLAFPADVKPTDGVGIAFAFKGDKTLPDRAFMTLRSSGGASYRSKNLNEVFKDDQWHDVVLTAQDFVLDPEFVQKNREKVASVPSTPDWSTINRMDFSVVGALTSKSYMARFGKFSFAVTKTPDGKTGTAEKPILVTVKDFTASKKIAGYGNINAGDPIAGTVYSVAVAATDPSLVVAATDDSGLVLSQDAGQTWVELNTPKKASNVTVDPKNPNIIYGSFFTDGVWKSTDKGKTWTDISETFGKDLSVKEVAISPVNSQNVYATYRKNFGGGVMRTNDGGKTWNNATSITADLEGNPTLQDLNGTKSTISCPTNVIVSPLDPQVLFVSCNWRACMSEDGGVTWTERNRGADISCITDIRFSGPRAYVAVMDEGTLVSENNGKSWKQLWPPKFSQNFSGHSWRLAINNINGEDRIIGTHTPWDKAFPSTAVVSMDGGNTYKISRTGLPDYTVGANTMWGRGYPRALAVDPKDPKIVYMGIDGDPTESKMGGGIFKSEDGGFVWAQLPNQPGSRRMFYGLMVDPTDSKRIFWASCGDRGGLYRSEDGGASWKNVFNTEQWLFNVLVTKEGVIYCPGKNLWRSTDHGATWKQVTNLKTDRTICGLEVDPRDPKTLWISSVTMSGSACPADGAVLKTTDDCATWTDITGNLPYVTPLVLRFNPATNELWVGGVALNKIKQ